MNCNLTNEDRKKGMLCRSWGCQPCLEFGVSKNDLNIIKTHMQIMTLKEEIEQLKQQLESMTNKCAELNYDKNCLISDLNQSKENERKFKQQLEDIHYFSDAYCLYELEKNYNVEREDIKKVEYCGGHGYTAVRIHFSNGTSVYESDETLAGMLLAWARIKNIQGE